MQSSIWYRFKGYSLQLFHFPIWFYRNKCTHNHRHLHHKGRNLPMGWRWCHRAVQHMRASTARSLSSFSTVVCQFNSQFGDTQYLTHMDFKQLRIKLRKVNSVPPVHCSFLSKTIRHQSSVDCTYIQVEAKIFTPFPFPVTQWLSLVWQVVYTSPHGAMHQRLVTPALISHHQLHRYITIHTFTHCIMVSHITTIACSTWSIKVTGRLVSELSLSRVPWETITAVDRDQRCYSRHATLVSLLSPEAHYWSFIYKLVWS